MGLLPSNNAERIAFFNTRTGLWTTNATAIGTTTSDVTALTALVTAASAALEAQTTAQNAAKAATDTVHNAMLAMTNSGMAIIEQVRTKARSAGDAVYPLANIPAPAIPSRRGAPGTPYKFAATLDGNGALNLKWKCENPAGVAGTIYQVYRRNSATGEPVYIGGSGSKTFVDATIPAGTTAITYQIQAVRSTGAGDWAQFNVNFGTGSAGGAMAIEETPMKKAA